MIYTIISFDRQEQKENSSKDVFVVNNPTSFLEKDISDYIKNTKNEKTRGERFLSYTSLFCGLHLFFGINKANISKTKDGKPYLAADGSDKKIYISLSHSDGISAVAISDEGEVGIDLQSEIDKEQAKRLDDRFLHDANAETKDLPIDYYYCYLDKEKAVFEKTEFEEAKSIDKNFALKWSWCESVLKLYGGGFSDLEKLRENNKSISTEIIEFNREKIFYLATSIEKKQ